MGLTRIRAEQISDIDYKQAVRAISLSNVTLTGGAPAVVDGVNLTVNDRILVNGQSTGSQNGIYQVQTIGTGSDGTWIRSTDTNATGELEAGTIVMVTEGTGYKDTQWKLTTNNPIIIGTTALTFEQNSAYAFGNVYANGTPVVASSVGDTLTLTPGTNISITGNASAKSVTIGVTGLSLNSISNGTSNVNVVSSGGNVTVGVNGAGNIVVVSDGGANVTGFLTASGNITGGNIVTTGNVTAGYFIGNGSQITGLSTTSNSISNGSSNVAITSAAANITVGVNGVANTVVISPGSIFVNGLFATPKTITSNVQMAEDSTATVISPLTIGNGYSMTIPNSSTVYVWIPS
jgi:hypothetical protein